MQTVSFPAIEGDIPVSTEELAQAYNNVLDALTREHQYRADLMAAWGRVKLAEAELVVARAAVQKLSEDGPKPAPFQTHAALAAQQQPKETR
jgi:hypothetical protein